MICRKYGGVGLDAKMKPVVRSACMVKFLIVPVMASIGIKDEQSILDVHQTLGLKLCIGTLCNLACWDDCGVLYSNPAISSLASLPCEDDMKASQGWRWQLFAALFVLWSVLVYQVLFPFLRRVKYHSSLGSNSHTEGILFLCLHMAHWCFTFWGRQM